MSEFDILFSDEFFIIDSLNLNSIDSKLYGFIIKDNQIFTNENFNKNNFSLLGSFVYVEKNNEEISIYQDFNGSYGIYLYRYGEYFCISNSFMKLVHYLRKSKHHLSLNEDYALAYLGSDLCSNSYKQTLINEIMLLPRIFILNINIKTKSVSFDRIIYEEHSIPINSIESLNILDNWFFQWTSLFNKLINDNNKVVLDLSGGFDSRMCLLLLLNSNIDFNNVFVNSLDDGLHSHNEDYRIASLLANKYGFNLNDCDFSNDRYYFNDLYTPLNISFHIKGGFHNQLKFQNYSFINPVYWITGYGGEVLRRFAESRESIIYRSKNLSPALVEPTINILDYNMENISKDFNMDIADFDAINYRETRRIFHFSKSTVENYLYNIFCLNPLLDKDLHKINIYDGNCDDNYLLLALIFLRYCPELLDVEFEANRVISQDTLDYAKEINNLKPFCKDLNILEKNHGYSIKSSINTHSTNNEKFSVKDIDSLLKNVYFSDLFKYSFESYFDSEIYNKNAQKVSSYKYFPLQFAYPSLFILKIIEDVTFNNNYYSSNFLNSWIGKFLKSCSNDENVEYYAILRNLMIYNTARLDIINWGKNCNIEFIDCSDVERILNIPNWLDFSKCGGIIIESFKNSLDLKVKCINDGVFRIDLRGKDVRDKNLNRFPVYIDFTKFLVNDETIFDKNILVWHDKPYFFTKSVSDGEIINIHVEWKPFSNNSLYE